MSRFNTGNPLGSGSPLDLDDNAKNMDLAVNSEDPQWVDRFGRSRLPLMEQERQFSSDQSSREAVFYGFLQASGYQDLSEYAPGIEITAHNQYVTFGGQPYLLKPSIPVPYTTSGEWTGDDFKLIGDAALRQDLTNPDKGAAMVARGVVAVDSIADLLALPEGQRKEGLRYLVKGFHPSSDVGGGEFYWDPSRGVEQHNGGAVLAGSAVLPNWNNALSVDGWFSGDGATGAGCFVLLFEEEVSLFQFGKSTGESPTSDQQVWQAAVNACAQDSRINRIVIPDVPHRLKCEESDAFSNASAIIVDGLEGVEFVGSGYTNAVMPSTVGAGALGFSLFRLQRSRNIKFSGFRIDGDFANHDTGQSGSRSGAFTMTTTDRTNQASFTERLSDICISRIQCDNIGGFVGVTRKSWEHAPAIHNVNISDNWGTDAAFVNNCIGLNIVLGGEIKRNRFDNTPTPTSPVPTMYIDVSRGCEQVVVEDNWGRYFVFGMKSEIAPEGNTPLLTSKNVTFKRNRLIEIGDPVLESVGVGSAAGGTYGIKVYSDTADVYGNHITARTLYRTTGGLISGIYTQTANGTVEGVIEVTSNTVRGAKTGILHGRRVSDRKLNTFIRDNTVIDSRGTGIIIQADCLAEENTVIGTAGQGIIIQIAANSRVRNNRLINCGGVNNQPLSQGDGGSSKQAGYFEFVDNEVQDTRSTGFPTFAYALQVSDNYAARYKLVLGEMNTPSTPLFQPYVGVFDRSDVKCSGQVNGQALSHLLSYNIASVTAVDANTVQVNYRRKVDFPLPHAVLTPMTAGLRLVSYGTTPDYYRVRFYDSATGALATPGTFNILVF